MRAFWNGNKMLSRKGNEIKLPKTFTTNFPLFPLDGELWMGRGKFSGMQSILNSDNGDWSEVEYHIFDSPDHSGVYEERIKSLNDLQLPDHVRVINISRCQDNAHLLKWLDQVTDEGGEGLIAVDPYLSYTIGRSSASLKIKASLKCH